MQKLHVAFFNLIRQRLPAGWAINPNMAVYEDGFSFGIRREQETVALWILQRKVAFVVGESGEWHYYLDDPRVIVQIVSMLESGWGTPPHDEMDLVLEYMAEGHTWTAERMKIETLMGLV